MQLINTLVAGVVGAEGGYAKLFCRGATRKARYYLDFEGSSVVSDGRNVALDANGGAVVYVDQAVDVVVYSSSNQEIRRFVDTATAACVEVMSSSFSGVDYETLVGGAGKPTTLSAVLDKLVTSFGARDFNVLMPDGTTKTLRQAIGSVSGVFYNVKSPQYGAVGDGVVDDGDSIRAAIAAADAAGGGTVFFPAGVYNTGAIVGINVPATVSLLGAGSAAVELRSGNNVDYSWVLEAGGFGVSSITGLRFTSSTTALLNMIRAESGARFSFRSCSFSASSTVGPCIDVRAWDSSSEKTQLSFDDCDFTASGSQRCISSLLSPRHGRVDVRRCRFVVQASFSGSSIASGACLHAYGCVFDNALATSGTYTCFAPGGLNGIYGSARCCEFTGGGGATVRAISCSGMTDSFESLTEDGNIFASSGITPYYGGGFGSTPGYYCKLGTREARVKTMNVTSTTVAVTEVLQYGVISIRSTGSGNFTMTFDEHVPLGSRLRVIFCNGDLSSRTLGFGGEVKGGTFTVASGEVIGLEFVDAAVNNGTSDLRRWFLVASSGPLTTGSDSSYSV